MPHTLKGKLDRIIRCNSGCISISAAANFIFYLPKWIVVELQAIVLANEKAITKPWRTPSMVSVIGVLPRRITIKTSLNSAPDECHHLLLGIQGLYGTSCDPSCSRNALIIDIWSGFISFCLVVVNGITTETRNHRKGIVKKPSGLMMVGKVKENKYAHLKKKDVYFNSCNRDDVILLRRWNKR